MFGLSRLQQDVDAGAGNSKLLALLAKNLLTIPARKKMREELQLIPSAYSTKGSRKRARLAFQHRYIRDNINMQRAKQTQYLSCPALPQRLEVEPERLSSEQLPPPPPKHGPALVVPTSTAQGKS